MPQFQYFEIIRVTSLHDRGVPFSCGYCTKFTVFVIVDIYNVLFFNFCKFGNTLFLKAELVLITFKLQFQFSKLAFTCWTFECWKYFFEHVQYACFLLWQSYLKCIRKKESVTTVVTVLFPSDVFFPLCCRSSMSPSDCEQNIAMPWQSVISWSHLKAPGLPCPLMHNKLYKPKPKY